MKIQLRNKCVEVASNDRCVLHSQTNRRILYIETFMKSVEKDAKERAENRKIRNERAETLKTIGNGAFKEKNYEKAVTYYSKALEQRKDSTVLWNNRALSYIQLGLFEKALADCEWALKVNNTNLKALLNSAKCYKQLGDEIKYKEYIQLAKERNPHFNKFINGILHIFLHRKHFYLKLTFLLVTFLSFFFFFTEFEESMDMRVNYQA